MSTLRRPDPRTVALAGLTTWAWYAVPDVVGPRWGRAVTKTVIGVGATALAVGVTREGREIRAGLQELRGALAAEVDIVPIPAPTHDVDERSDDSGAHDANPAPVPETGPDLAVGKLPVAVAGGVLAALVLSGAAAVAGERWVYRKGESLRERGVRAPHTKVGLVMGLLASGLALVDLDLDDTDDTDPTDDTTHPDASA